MTVTVEAYPLSAWCHDQLAEILTKKALGRAEALAHV